ncbi:MAG: hypothetical protein O3C16_01890 [Actinobacteria bacterium]|nr:hypothetical protein [Actinomycetota bacterium]
MANQRGFASDNYAGVHPEVMARMASLPSTASPALVKQRLINDSIDFN